MPGVGKIKSTVETIKRRTTVTAGRGNEEDRAKALANDKTALEEVNKAIDAQTEKVKAQTEGTNERAAAQEKLNELLAIQIRLQRDIQKMEEPTLNFGDALKDLWNDDLPRMIQGAASEMADSMASVFEKMGVSIKTIRQSILDMPKGLAKGMLKELAEVSKTKAKEHLAWAISETARAIGDLASLNPAGAALHAASAAKHYLAATAWSAVSGSAAGGAGGGSSGAPSLDGNTGSSADTAKGPVTLFIRGGLLNTDDTEQMDQFAKAIYSVSGRDVVVRRG